ncbi:MAG: hypothetical protein GQ574_13230 [Crocinitomix sp.]|nr:hypothetical protein [Crocinitomix sp.]
MSLLDSVLNYLRGKEKGEELAAPEGVCAICWGHSEYDNKVRDIVRDHQIDVNAGRENYAFIQDFVVKHVDGIKLKNTPTGGVCPVCSKK